MLRLKPITGTKFTTKWIQRKKKPTKIKPIKIEIATAMTKWQRRKINKVAENTVLRFCASIAMRRKKIKIEYCFCYRRLPFARLCCTKKRKSIFQVYILDIFFSLCFACFFFILLILFIAHFSSITRQPKTTAKGIFLKSFKCLSS